MMIWSDEQIDFVIQRWNAGYSAAVIAKALDVPRNAVIGKVWRLRDSGVALRGGAPKTSSRNATGQGSRPRVQRKQVERPASRSEKTRSRTPPKPAPTPQSLPPRSGQGPTAPAVPVLPADPVLLVDRKPGQCAFPLWPHDARPHHPLYGMVCGAPVDKTRAGQPVFCAHHCEVAIRPAKATADWQDACETIARKACKKGLA